MPESLTDAQKVLRNDTGIRMAAALEVIASGVEPSTVIAPEYDGSQTYAVGDLVMYRSVLYRCTTAITTPEAWTAAHWTATSVTDEYRPAAAQDVIDAGKETAGLGLTGASVGDLVRVKTVDANGKPTSWNHVPLCDIVTNENLLDNWYFVGGGSQQGDGIFPINRRGLTAYSTEGTGIDRWSVRAGLSCIVATTGLNLSSSSESGGVLYQYLNSPASLLGKQVCLSALIGDYLYSGTVTVPDNYPTSNTVILSVTIPNGYVRIRILRNGPIEATLNVLTSANVTGVKAVKLEVGAEQTLAHQEGSTWVLNELPDFEDQLIRCRTSTADTSDEYANSKLLFDSALDISDIPITAAISDLENTAIGKSYGRVRQISITQNNHPISASSRAWVTLYTISATFAPSSDVRFPIMLNATVDGTTVETVYTGRVRPNGDIQIYNATANSTLNYCNATAIYIS